MANRRKPLQSSHISTIVYPSALFSLEKDEVLPYERFAYNLLDIAVEALNLKGLPERIDIDFSAGTAGRAPWLINASVQCETNSGGTPSGFRFSTPEMLPTLAYVYCFSFGAEVFQSSIDDIRQRLQRFLDGANAGVRQYKQQGFAAAVRACYDHFGLTIADASAIMNEYDSLTKLIAFHEVGHAYALHLTAVSGANLVRRRGFELIADLLAITWMYNKLVRNTPNTDEYREMRGFTSHSEAIFSNCLMVQRAQQALLCLMTIAGAQRNGGTLTLEGGETHPPGMQRHLLQHIHFTTLVGSNFANVLSKEQLAAVNSDWDSVLERLLSAGVIPISDFQTNLDPREFDTVEAAADVIEEMDIWELRPAAPLLKDMRDILLAALKSSQDKKGK